jgi:hypothetical protein
MISHPNRSGYGRRVRIVSGMSEVVGRTGTVIDREGMLLRVRLDEPVYIEAIGRYMTDDLWEPRALKTHRA